MQIAPNSDTPKVVISVLNWNGWMKTTKCIEAILCSRYSNYEIVIVDNCSQDDLVERLSEAFPNIRLIRSENNLGYAGGNRLAVDYAIDANYDAIWILNNDTFVEPDSLSELVRAYSTHGECLYGSLPVNSFDGGSTYVVGRAFYGMAPDEKPDFENVIVQSGVKPSELVQLGDLNIANLNGNSMLIPLEVVKKYGFMREEYFLYAEEWEYCFRLAALGVPSVLVVTSVVRHEERGSSRESTSINAVVKYYHIRNQLIVLREYGSATDYKKRLFSRLRTLKRLLKSWVRDQVKAKRYMPLPFSTRLTALAIFHGVLRITGKTFAPEDFID